MPYQKLKKMIWFFDPVQHKSDMTYEELEAIGEWATKKGMEIIPFYSLSPRSISWVGIGSPPILDNFVPLIKSQMENCLEGIQQDHILEPVVHVSEHMNEREVMKDIRDYCDQEDIGSVLVFASDKSSVERFYLGSFSDTLLFSLHLPSFVLPLASESINIDNPLLVPFDLSEDNYKAIVKFFKSDPPVPHTKVTIFYKASRPEELFVQTGVHFAGGGWLSMEEFHKGQVEKSQAQCDKLGKEIAAAGFEVEVKVDGDFGNIEDGIREYCKGHPISAMILFTNATPSSSILLGSLTRQLLRDPPTALWVLHQKS